MCLAIDRRIKVLLYSYAWLFGFHLEQLFRASIPDLPDQAFWHLVSSEQTHAATRLVSSLKNWNYVYTPPELKFQCLVPSRSRYDL
jgi:hypothetical protein